MASFRKISKRITQRVASSMLVTSFRYLLTDFDAYFTLSEQHRCLAFAHKRILNFNQSSLIGAPINTKWTVKASFQLVHLHQPIRGRVLSISLKNFSKIESIWPGTGWKNLLKKVVTGQLFWGPVMIFVFFSYNEREYDRKYRFYYFK